eukprot:s64_g31.t1
MPTSSTKDGSTLTMSNCIAVEGNGGGFYARQGLEVTNRSRVAIEQATAGKHGGGFLASEQVSVTSGSTLSMSNCTAEDGNGGGFNAKGLQVTNCSSVTIEQARAGKNGGSFIAFAKVSVTSGSTLTLSNCAANGDGGGFNVQGLQVTNGSSITIQQASARKSGGGFLALEQVSVTSGSTLSMSNCTAEDGNGGGGVKGVVMVLDHDVLPLTRVWCLFEYFLGSQLNVNVSLATDTGVFEDSGCNYFTVALKAGEKLKSLSILNCGASKEADKEYIFQHIMSHMGGLEHMERRIQHLMGHSLAKSIQYFNHMTDRHLAELGNQLAEPVMTEVHRDAFNHITVQVMKIEQLAMRAAVGLVAALALLLCAVFPAPFCSLSLRPALWPFFSGIARSAKSGSLRTRTVNRSPSKRYAPLIWQLRAFGSLSSPPRQWQTAASAALVAASQQSFGAIASRLCRLTPCRLPAIFTWWPCAWTFSC